MSCKRTQVTWADAGLGESKICLHTWEALTELLVTHQPENWNFCRCHGCSFPDCTAPALLCSVKQFVSGGG